MSSDFPEPMARANEGIITPLWGELPICDTCQEYISGEYEDGELWTCEYCARTWTRRDGRIYPNWPNDT